jgi:hypothetical protein
MQIVNVRGKKPGDDGIIYCGLAWAGWEASPLGNPCRKGFKCSVCKEVHKTPGETLPCYKYWLFNSIVQENPSVLNEMKKLKSNSILGCWCSPQRCHCEIIIEAWERFVDV